jgi:flagellar FliL protein
MSTAPATTQDKPADEAPAPKKSGLKKIILLAVPVLVAALLAGLWFTGVLPRLLGLQHEEPKVQAVNQPRPPPVFFDLPEMIANLNGNPRRPSYVKMTVRLELAKPEDAERVRAELPRLLDLFQTYLREMRPEELRGSAGTYRLREELIVRANVATAPARINDVLFIQMLIQ